MWKFVLAAFLLTASPVWAQQQATAYDALRVVSTQLSRAMMARIISVAGVDGDPQPVKWTIRVADRRQPGGVLEIEVANGRVLSQRAPTGMVGSLEGATIQTARLNLDSSGAFAVASATAEKSHSNFDYVSYTLRNNDRGFPIWIVTLQDINRRPIGTIHIGANKGNVTRVEGMFRGRNLEPVPQQRQPSRPEDNYYTDEQYYDDTAAGEENIVKKEIKRVFRRTKADAKRMFGRVRRSFDEFIERRR